MAASVAPLFGRTLGIMRKGSSVVETPPGGHSRAQGTRRGAVGSSFTTLFCARVHGIRGLSSLSESEREREQLSNKKQNKTKWENARYPVSSGGCGGMNGSGSDRIRALPDLSGFP